LFGCAGKAQDSAGANRGSGGNAAGGDGGRLTAICGAFNNAEASEVATGDTGEGGTGGAAPVEQERLHTCGWDVKVSVKQTELPDSNLTPILASLALDDSTALTGLLSVQGQVTPLALIRDSSTRAHLDPPESGVRFASMDLHTLTLTAFDDDSDGIADRLEGNGEGTVDTPCGDCAPVRVPATFTLSAKPDRTPPKLDLPASPLSPLDYVTMTVSEALQSATLALTGTSTVPLDPSGKQLNRFENSAVLAFGGSWQITGKGQDFAGLSLDLSGAALTTIEPGVFAEDGFETQPLASLGANSSWIDESSGLPIPSGSRAVLVQYNPVLFHLKRSEASTKVSLRVIGLSRGQSNGTDSAELSIGFQSAVIGSTNRGDQRAAVGTPALPTSHATWTLATEPRTVEFELQDAGSDVAVEISAGVTCPGASQVGFGSCSASGALVIDDLHVE
jgi:hypothetical protein